MPALLDVMCILRLNRIDHVDPPHPMSDDDISQVVAQALKARFPKVIGFGPPATSIVHADGTTPRPSVALSLVGARVMVVREKDLPEVVNGTAPVEPRLVT